MDTMLALVSGSPRAVRIASDQAFWFCPVGVSFCAVGCGVSVDPEAGWDADAWVLACVMLGVAVAECRAAGDEAGVRAARLAGTDATE